MVNLMDYSKFDFEFIFGILADTQHMINGQLFLRSEIVDRTIAEHSGGQLVYVGDKENGFDFVSRIIDQIEEEKRKIENKTKKKLFAKSRDTGLIGTQPIVLKNFYRHSPPSYPSQVCDELLLWDEHTHSVYSCSWETVQKYWYLTGSTCSFKGVPKSELKVIVENIVPVKVESLSTKLNDLIKDYITQDTTSLSRRKVESLEKTLQLCS